MDFGGAMIVGSLSPPGSGNSSNGGGGAPTVPLTKPRDSYASMIAMAIDSSPNHRLSLSEIYDWIERRHPYYSKAEKSWKVRWLWVVWKSEKKEKTWMTPFGVHIRNSPANVLLRLLFIIPAGFKVELIALL